MGIASIEQSGVKVMADASRLREEIKVLESNAEACEEDKMSKDNQIHTLRDEIAHQEEIIVKLQREKKEAGGGRQKTEEEMTAMEDKAVHLGKVKSKLEMSLDECEDVLEREKKSKGDVEKIKRKIEGDLKLTQEAASDLERINSELSQTVQRKEKEVSSIAAKIEDEQTLGQVKQDVDRKIAEKEEEFNNTRKNHARAMDSMQASLESEQGAKAEALRIKKKLEGEINELEIALDHANKANNEALKSTKRYQG